MEFDELETGRFAEGAVGEEGLELFLRGDGVALVSSLGGGEGGEEGGVFPGLLVWVGGWGFLLKVLATGGDGAVGSRNVLRSCGFVVADDEDDGVELSSHDDAEFLCGELEAVLAGEEDCSG